MVFIAYSITEWQTTVTYTGYILNLTQKLPSHRCIVLVFTNPFQTREEGKALLRQILQLRNQGETSSTDIAAPFFLPASLSANNTPTRRVSPLNLSSVTPWTMLILLCVEWDVTDFIPVKPGHSLLPWRWGVTRAHSWRQMCPTRQRCSLCEK